MILTRTIADIALILYFFTDHPLYFNSIGFKTYEKTFLNNMDYINNVFWLANSLLDIVVTLADMQHLQTEIKSLVSFYFFKLLIVCNREAVRHVTDRREARGS